MGLTYHDSKQFLDAVKRNDALAAELFIAGRGRRPFGERFLGPRRRRLRARATTTRPSPADPQESPRSAFSAASAATAAVSVLSTRGPSEAGTKPALDEPGFFLVGKSRLRARGEDDPAFRDRELGQAERGRGESRIFAPSAAGR